MLTLKWCNAQGISIRQNINLMKLYTIYFNIFLYGEYLTKMQGNIVWLHYVISIADADFYVFWMKIRARQICKVAKEHFWDVYLWGAPFRSCNETGPFKRYNKGSGIQFLFPRMWNHRRMEPRGMEDHSVECLVS